MIGHTAWMRGEGGGVSGRESVVAATDEGEGRGRSLGAGRSTGRMHALARAPDRVLVSRRALIRERVGETETQRFRINDSDDDDDAWSMAINLCHRESGAD